MATKNQSPLNTVSGGKVLDFRDATQKGTPRKFKFLYFQEAFIALMALAILSVPLIAVINGVADNNAAAAVGEETNSTQLDGEYTVKDFKIVETSGRYNSTRCAILLTDNTDEPRYAVRWDSLLCNDLEPGMKINVKDNKFVSIAAGQR